MTVSTLSQAEPADGALPDLPSAESGAQSYWQKVKEKAKDNAKGVVSPYTSLAPVDAKEAQKQEQLAREAQRKIQESYKIGTHQSVKADEKTLPGSDAMLQSAEQAAFQTGVDALKFIDYPLFKYLEVGGGLSSIKSNQEYHVVTLMPLSVSPGEKSIWFIQPSFYNFVDRPTLNLGLGYRSLSEEGDFLWGVNTFWDNDLSENNQRVSLGLEYKSALTGVSGNYYQRLSSWKRSSVYELRFERPANGWDIRVEQALGWYPQIKLTGAYESWMGSDVDPLGSSEFYNDPQIWEAGISYKPNSLFDLSYQHKQVMGGESDDQIQLNFIYQFGIPLSEQFKFNFAPIEPNPQERLYDKVVRSYRVVLETKKAIPEIKLPPNIIVKEYKKIIVPLKVTNADAIDSYYWHPAGGIVLNSDTQRNPQLTAPQYRRTVSGNSYPLSVTVQTHYGTQLHASTLVQVKQDKNLAPIVKVTNTDNFDNGVPEFNAGESDEVKIKYDVAVTGERALKTCTVTVDYLPEGKFKNCKSGKNEFYFYYIPDVEEGQGSKSRSASNQPNQPKQQYMTITATDDTGAETAQRVRINITGSILGKISAKFDKNHKYGLTNQAIPVAVKLNNSKSGHPVKFKEVIFTVTDGKIALLKPPKLPSNKNFTPDVGWSTKPLTLITNDAGEVEVYVTKENVGNLIIEASYEASAQKTTLKKDIPFRESVATPDGIKITSEVDKNIYQGQYHLLKLELNSPETILRDTLYLKQSGNANFCPPKTTAQLTAANNISSASCTSTIELSGSDFKEAKVYVPVVNYHAEKVDVSAKLGQETVPIGTSDNLELKFLPLNVQILPDEQSGDKFPAGKAKSFTVNLLGGNQLFKADNKIEVTLDDLSFDDNSSLNNKPISQTQTFDISEGVKQFNVIPTGSVGETGKIKVVAFAADKELVGVEAEYAKEIMADSSTATVTELKAEPSSQTVGQVINLIATVKDANGNTVSGIDVDWTSTIGQLTDSNAHSFEGGSGSVTRSTTNDRGEAVIELKSTTADTGSVAAQVKGSDHESMMTPVTFVAGAASADTSTFTVDSQPVEVGKSVAITVNMTDADGNPVTLTNNDLANLMASKDASSLDVGSGPTFSTFTGDNGQYKAEVSSDNVGTVKVKVAFNREHLTLQEQGNATATFEAGAADATQSTFTVTTGDITVNHKATVTVNVKDGKGNPTDDVEVSKLNASLGGYTGKPPVLKFTKVAKVKGQYTADFTDKTAEVVTVSVTLDSQPVKKGLNNTASFVAGAADATQSTFTVDSQPVEVGKSVAITVNMTDADGNPVTLTNNDLANLMASKDASSLDVGSGPTFSTFTGDNGQYKAEVSSDNVGTVKVKVAFNREHLTLQEQGNATATFEAGAADATQSTFTVTTGDITVNHKATVTVNVKDGKGNPTDDVEVSKLNASLGGYTGKPPVLKFTKVAKVKGQYTADFTDKTAEVVTVSVTLDSQPVKKGLNNTASFVAGAADATQSTFTVDSQPVEVGKSVAITVNMTDADGNPVTLTNNDLANLMASKDASSLDVGSGPTFSTFTGDNGQYKAEVSSDNVGTVKVKVAFNREHLTLQEQGNATATFEAGAADATQSTFTVTTGDITVNHKATVTVNVKDGKGNPTDDVEVSKLNASLGGYTGKPPVLKFTKVAKVKGQYTADFTDKTAEVVTVSVTLDSQPVKKGLNNTASFVAGAADATQSTFTVDSQPVEVGKSVAITVNMTDADGNPVTLTNNDLANLMASKDASSLDVGSGPTFSTFTGDNGQYKAEVSSDNVGTVKVKVAFNREHLTLQEQGNATATFEAGAADATQSTFTVTTGDITVNHKATVTVNVKDGKGNPTDDVEVSKLNASLGGYTGKPPVLKFTKVAKVKGQYTADFTDKTAEVVTVSVTLDSQPVKKGLNNTASFVAGAADATQSTFTVDSQPVEVGKSVAITVNMTDADGNPVTLTNNDLANLMASKDASSLDVGSGPTFSTFTGDNGQYKAEVSSDNVGTVKVKVAFNREHLTLQEQGNATATFEAGAADATQSTFTVTTGDITVNHKATVTVNVKDGKGNPTDDVEVSKLNASLGGYTGKPPVLKFTKVAKVKGQYTADFTDKTAEVVTVSVTLDSQPVKKGLNNTASFVAGAADATQSTFTVDSQPVEVGKSVAITVNMTDADGNPVTLTNNDLANLMASKDASSLDVGSGPTFSTFTGDNGQYKAEVSSDNVGTVKVKVAFNREHLTLQEQGNATATFEAGAADATQSTFTVTTGDITVNHKATVTVNVKDGKGNPTDDVEVSKLNASLGGYTGKPPVLKFTKVAKVKGQYTADFTDKTAEVVTVSVTLDSQPVKKGLNNTASFVAGAADATQSTFTVDSQPVEVGKSVAITVNMTDADGNPVTLTNNDLANLMASKDASSLDVGSGPTFSTFTGDNGQYKAEVSSDNVGTVKVKVAFNREHLTLQEQGNATATFEAGAADATQSTFTVTTGDITVNHKATVTVNVKDGKGNPTDDVEVSKLNASLGGYTGKPPVLKFTKVAKVKGQYTADFTDKTAEVVTVSVTLDSQPVKKGLNNTASFVAGAADATQSTFTVDSQPVEVGKSVAITVNMTDADGNPVTLTNNDLANLMASKDASSLDVGSGPTFSTFTGDNGQYKAEVSSDNVGTVKVKVAFNREHLTLQEQGNATATFEAGAADATQSTFTVTTGDITVNHKATVTVNVKDGKGNPTDDVEVSKLNASLGGYTGKPPVLKFTKVAKVKGQYTADFTDKTAEVVTVSVTLDSQPVKKGLNNTASFVAGAADATQSTFTVDSQPVEVGKSVAITVNMTDADGNPVTLTNNDLANLMASKDASSLDVGSGPTFSTFTGDNGQYKAEVSSDNVGTVKVKVAFNREHLTLQEQGNATATFEAGAADATQSTFTVTTGDITVNHKATVTVNVKDGKGNPTDDVEVSKLNASLGGYTGKPPVLKFTKVAKVKGQYTADFTDKTAEVVTVSVTLDSQPVKKGLNNTASFVAGAADATQSTFTVDSQPVEVGKSVAITVNMTDADGNPVTLTNNDLANLMASKDASSLDVGSGPTFSTFTGDNGQYKAEVSSDNVGTVKVKVAFNREHLTLQEQGNATATFEAGAADATQSTFTVTTGDITVNHKATVTVNVKDGKGNPTDDVEVSKLNASLGGYTGKPPVLKFTKVAKVKGQYTADFTDKTAEVVTVSVTLDSQPVKKGLNNTASFVAGAADATQSTFTVDSQPVEVGKSVAITVNMTDADGNPVTLTNNDLANLMASKDASSLDVGSGPTFSTFTGDNGQYKAEVSSDNVGTVKVKVAFNREHLTLQEQGNATATFNEPPISADKSTFGIEFGSTTHFSNNKDVAKVVLTLNNTQGKPVENIDVRSFEVNFDQDSKPVKLSMFESSAKGVYEATFTSRWATEYKINSVTVKKNGPALNLIDSSDVTITTAQGSDNVKFERAPLEAKFINFSIIDKAYYQGGGTTVELSLKPFGDTTGADKAEYEYEFKNNQEIKVSVNTSNEDVVHFGSKNSENPFVELNNNVLNQNKKYKTTAYIGQAGIRKFIAKITKGVNNSQEVHSISFDLAAVKLVLLDSNGSDANIHLRFPTNNTTNDIYTYKVAPVNSGGPDIKFSNNEGISFNTPLCNNKECKRGTELYISNYFTDSKEGSKFHITTYNKTGTIKYRLKSKMGVDYFILRNSGGDLLQSNTMTIDIVDRVTINDVTVKADADCAEKIGDNIPIEVTLKDSILGQDDKLNLMIDNGAVFNDTGSQKITLGASDFNGNGELTSKLYIKGTKQGLIKIYAQLFNTGSSELKETVTIKPSKVNVVYNWTNNGDNAAHAFSTERNNITYTFSDSNGIPIVGANVSMSIKEASAKNTEFYPVNNITNDLGQVSFGVSNSKPETIKVSVRLYKNCTSGNPVDYYQDNDGKEITFKSVPLKIKGKSPDIWNGIPQYFEFEADGVTLKTPVEWTSNPGDLNLKATSKAGRYLYRNEKDTKATTVVDIFIELKNKYGESISKDSFKANLKGTTNISGKYYPEGKIAIDRHYSATFSQIRCSPNELSSDYNSFFKFNSSRLTKMEELRKIYKNFPNGWITAHPNQSKEFWSSDKFIAGIYKIKNFETGKESQAAAGLRSYNAICWADYRVDDTHP